MHTLTLDFLVPMDALKIPLTTDPNYPNGFPRHGAPDTVDPGGWRRRPTPTPTAPASASCASSTRQRADRAQRAARRRGLRSDVAALRDQMELWRKNKTFDLAFHDADVLTSAQMEYTTNANGRIRFTPPK